MYVSEYKCFFVYLFACMCQNISASLCSQPLLPVVRVDGAINYTRNNPRLAYFVSYFINLNN